MSREHILAIHWLRYCAKGSVLRSRVTCRYELEMLLFMQTTFEADVVHDYVRGIGFPNVNRAEVLDISARSTAIKVGNRATNSSPLQKFRAEEIRSCGIDR